MLVACLQATPTSSGQLVISCEIGFAELARLAALQAEGGVGLMRAAVNVLLLYVVHIHVQVAEIGKNVMNLFYTRRGQSSHGLQALKGPL